VSVLTTPAFYESGPRHRRRGPSAEPGRDVQARLVLARLVLARGCAHAPARWRHTPVTCQCV